MEVFYSESERARLSRACFQDSPRAVTSVKCGGGSPALLVFVRYLSSGASSLGRQIIKDEIEFYARYSTKSTERL